MNACNIVICLARFVNILTEKGQKGLFAQPVHRLAESVRFIK